MFNKLRNILEGWKYVYFKFFCWHGLVTGTIHKVELVLESIEDEKESRSFTLSLVEFFWEC